jgi:hypothetical protein
LVERAKNYRQNDSRHCRYTLIQFPLQKTHVMIIAGIFILLFLLVVGALLVPVELYINTTSNQYYVQLKGLARASVEGNAEEVIRIRLRAFYRNFYFYPLKYMGMPKTKKLKKSIEIKRKKKVPVRNILRVLKSFKVKKLFVDIDTGNCITNAKLYPAFAFLNYYHGGFNINFEGRNQLVLFIQNKPIYIIKSFINL